MVERKDYALSLSPKEIKLARLAFDKGAIDGEAAAAFMKLRQSLMNDGALAVKEATAKNRIIKNSMPPSSTLRQPGDTLVPFGQLIGTPIKNLSRQELLRILIWCQQKAPEKFAYLIRDISSLLTR